MRKYYTEPTRISRSTLDRVLSGGQSKTNICIDTTLEEQLSTNTLEALSDGAVNLLRVNNSTY